MIKTPLGKTGLEVSPLGFGAAQIGYLKTEQEHAAQILNFLLDQGVNVIDTASAYGNSEELIGQSVAQRRGQFVLISKCGIKLPDISASAWSAELITQTVDRSLRRLRADAIDVMLLHSCDEQTLRKGEAIAGLLKARESGKIRFAGYSGDNQAAAYAATLPDIAVIETSISLADQANIDLVLPAARKNRIGVLAKRSIANAAWKDLSAQPGFYKDYASEYTQRLKKMKLDPSALGISGPPESAWPELALRFTLSQEGVTTAIIGSTNLQNVQRNIQYVAKGPLPPQTVQNIREAFARAKGRRSWPGLG